MVEAVAPGASDREAEVNVPVQPLGTLEESVKADVVQGLTSLLVTDRV